MRRTFGKNLRASRYAIAGYGSRGRDAERSAATATTAAPSVVRATATARERVATLAVASVNGAIVRHQGCSRLAITLFHCRRRSYPRLLVSHDAVVALATTPCRDDLATIAHQPEVRALSIDGQHTPAATGTPVQPQLAIPAGAGDSATAASSFLLPLSVMVKPTPTSELEAELSRHAFISSGGRIHMILSSSIIAFGDVEVSNISLHFCYNDKRIRNSEIKLFAP